MSFGAAMIRNMTIEERLHYGVEITRNDVETLEQEAHERGVEAGYEEGYKIGYEDGEAPKL